MFRLDVSHLQAHTISLPDALSTLGSHSVYMWITYLLKLLEKLPKQPHRGRNTVNKNSGKQRQHPREDTSTVWNRTNHKDTQEKILTSTVWNKTNHKGWKTEKQRNTHIDKNRQENSTRHYHANTPGGDTRKLTQLSIINKASRNIPIPTVIRQRHPTVEHPVNISALKMKEFYALVVSCLNTACK